MTDGEDLTANGDEAGKLAAIREIALEAMPYSLCVFDAQLRLVLHNHRLLEQFGLSADAVRPGTPLDALLRRGAETRGLPTRAGQIAWRRLRRRLVQRVAVHQRWRFQDGGILSARFVPIASGGWLVTCDELSEDENAARELREQHRRFDAALNNMSQGLCMFDAEQRMIVCNGKYRSIFYGDPEVIKPGVTLRGVFEHGIEKGIYPGLTVDELMARRLATLRKGTTSVYDQKMIDGRTIEILISPMANGGWVGTFEDVTEIRRVEAERATAVAELRERNMLLDATLESMGQGLSVFDAKSRLVIGNQRYLDIYRLDAETAKPGTHVTDLIRHTRELGLERDEPDIAERYEEMKTRFLDNRETLVHRHFADGRIIAICSQPMADGGWVSTFEDITERERAAGELREQHRRFDAALNNMPHGLAMLDEELNLIVCNKRYLEIYGMDSAIVKPGAAMREIIAHSIEAGYQAGDASPDQILQSHVECLAAGDHLLHHDLVDGRVVKVIYQSMPQGGWVVIHEDVTEKKRSEQHIAYMASHDALTDLPNRTLLRDRMEEGLAKVSASGEEIAILCLDLDNFKRINDTLGHPVGDRLLRAVADRLRQATRSVDTVARLGGDEFAILQSGSSREEAEALALNLVSIMAEPVVIDDNRINSGVSVGIAMAPAHGLTAGDLMKCADLALYRAKAEGRCMFRFFEPDMDVRVRARRALELDLSQALARNEFHLVFQPQVRAADRELTGFEALLRWAHPGRGPVSPVEFIPIAEETGLITAIGEWVLREACMEAARWPDPIRIAVNLSPVQFKKPGLVTVVTSALAAAGLSPRRLELEITEAVLLQDDEVTMAALHQLRALGIRISMDDFGIGYSSLSYLRSFPFDKIKIDRSFVANLEGNSENFAIIRAIAGLGTSLGVETTAEGVETEAQLKLIQNGGCSEVQGYLVSPPKGAADTMRFIGNSLRRSAAA